MQRHLGVDGGGGVGGYVEPVPLAIGRCLIVWQRSRRRHYQDKQRKYQQRYRRRRPRRRCHDWRGLYGERTIDRKVSQCVSRDGPVESRPRPTLNQGSASRVGRHATPLSAHPRRLWPLLSRDTPLLSPPLNPSRYWQDPRSSDRRGSVRIRVSGDRPLLTIVPDGGGGGGGGWALIHRRICRLATIQVGWNRTRDGEHGDTNPILRMGWWMKKNDRIGFTTRCACFAPTTG